MSKKAATMTPGERFEAAAEALSAALDEVRKHKKAGAVKATTRAQEKAHELGLELNAAAAALHLDNWAGALGSGRLSHEREALIAKARKELEPYDAEAPAVRMPPWLRAEYIDSDENTRSMAESCDIYPGEVWTDPGDDGVRLSIWVDSYWQPILVTKFAPLPAEPMSIYVPCPNGFEGGPVEWALKVARANIRLIAKASYPMYRVQLGPRARESMKKTMQLLSLTQVEERDIRTVFDVAAGALPDTPRGVESARAASILSDLLDQLLDGFARGGDIGDLLRLLTKATKRSTPDWIVHPDTDDLSRALAKAGAKPPAVPEVPDKARPPAKPKAALTFPNTYQSVRDIAGTYGLAEHESALRHRLRRWRKKHDDGWTDAKKETRNDPKLLYRPAAVESVITGMIKKYASH